MSFFPTERSGDSLPVGNAILGKICSSRCDTRTDVVRNEQLLQDGNGTNDEFYESTKVALAPVEKYRVLTKLDSGGIVRVYLAVSNALAGFNQLVVLKSLRSDLNAHLEFGDAFRRDARVWARMSHPNVVVVNGVEERDRGPIIVMEYLQGQPLSAILHRTHSKVPLGMRLRILADGLCGLHYIHELACHDGLSLRQVHSGFTPQAIFVTYDGAVKVLDFGLAQVARFEARDRMGSLKGKLRYMSPEQVTGAPLDRRADVFAAGIMLCEMVTGRRFWGDSSDAEVVKKLICGNFQTPISDMPSCPPELDRICATALAFERNSRYQTVAEMQADIDAFLSTHSERVTTEALGSALSACFDKERKQAQQLIETRIANGTYEPWSCVSDASSDTYVSKTPLAIASQISPNLSARLSQVMTVGRRRLVTLLGPVAIGFGGVCGVTILINSAAFQPNVSLASVNVNPPSPKSTLTPTPKKPHLVRITALPASVVLSSDGISVNQNPFAKEYVDDEGWHAVRVHASGYKSFEKRLQFNHDIELVISLEANGTSKNKAKSSPKDSSSGTRIAGVPSSPHDARASCLPPYTFDRRGVKRFKVECL